MVHNYMPKTKNPKKINKLSAMAPKKANMTSIFKDVYLVT